MSVERIIRFHFNGFFPCFDDLQSYFCFFTPTPQPLTADIEWLNNSKKNIKMLSAPLRLLRLSTTSTISSSTHVMLISLNFHNIEKENWLERWQREMDILKGATNIISIWDSIFKWIIMYARHVVNHIRFIDFCFIHFYFYCL